MSSVDPNYFMNLSYSLTNLRLPFCDLHGNFPENVFNLPNIEYLNLDYNPSLTCQLPKLNWTSPLVLLSASGTPFYGGLPESIGNLKSLQVSMDIFSKLQQLTWLGLSANNLTLISSNNSSVNFVLPNLEIYGQIPKLSWKDIGFLDLHSNSFQGDLPMLPHSITSLSVSNNNLTGDISNICNMKFLEILDLSRNNFSGIIPQCVGNLSQSLSVLNLKMNKFHGKVPPTFQKGCGLMYLNLNNNDLEGPLTPTTSNCKDLEVLDLGNNMINGTFPHWIEALPELQVLVLHSNNFQGLINGASKNPQSLLKLQIIDLSYNNFSGPLPTTYMENLRAMMNLDKGKVAAYINGGYDFSIALVVKGLEIEFVKILTIFTSIDLSMNNFQGEISRTIGELISLRGLNLSHNNLIGHIPPSLGNLSSLEWLDLSSNKLDGQIPRELLDLTFLSLFNVSYNHLVGPIPQGKQFHTYENDSYQGNEGLCGPPLSRGCSTSKQPQQPLPAGMNSHNDGSMFEFGWKIVAIGYGFGFVFGVGLGYVALRMGKPKWLMTLFKLK
ncbi:hypothetical protein COLO4_07055 [Corchorus olitorius]|uniref:Uncharacterized protein n=1 Tax=Corchorus olitorius TaxID=93759 RepID=A0A1R3KL44_9ROSI|nr:hypothetical protein COLO4_07055 [Corchorus olitorius]